MKIQIELQHFIGCPNSPILIESVKKAIKDGLNDAYGKAQSSTATKDTAQQAKILADNISKTIRLNLLF